MGELLARATRRPAVAHVRHVAPVPPRDADGLVAAVYRQVERDFGMLAPPVSLHSPAPDVLAACWLMLRESLIATPSHEPVAQPTPSPGPAARATGSPGQPSGVAAFPPRAATPPLPPPHGVATLPQTGPAVVVAATREAKEAVAAAVSLSNRCPYCVEVHGATLIGLVRSPDAIAIAEGRFDAVSDPALLALARWAYGDGSPAPFGSELAPGFVGVAVAFHYLNRMVNLFLQDSLLPSGVPKAARRRINRVAARIMGSLARDARAPGDSVHLLPEAPLPADMAWADGAPGVADAFARASAAIERAGERSVPPDVRALVQGWAGDGPGLSTREWLDNATAELSEADRTAGRLAMLIAFASHQVPPSLIEEFQSEHPRDESLIEFAAWVSLTAARRIGAHVL